jgi:hypothetical protein
VASSGGRTRCNVPRRRGERRPDRPLLLQLTLGPTFSPVDLDYLTASTTRDSSMTSCTAFTGGQLPPVEELIARAVAERDAKLPSELFAVDLPSPLPRNVISLAHERTPAEERRILSFDLTGLAREIAAGRISSQAVFRAYAARAVLSQQLVRHRDPLLRPSERADPDPLPPHPTPDQLLDRL